MLGLVLYVLAVMVGLLLFWCYEPKEEQEVVDSDLERPPKKQSWQLSSIFNTLGLNLSPQEETHFEAFTEHFASYQEVSEACRRAGLGRTNLVIGVDFTASNEWQGRKSFNQNCLHRTCGSRPHNPYQKVIWVLGQTLAPFDHDNLIPTYGFGDSETLDEEVFAFREDELPCRGCEEVLDRYNDIVKGVTLAGPTSFKPIIAKAIELVKRSGQYHILVIIADGQVTEEGPTIDAIVEASKHPLSIVVVGVGDGPWDIMLEFDHRLPKRRFDNFRFVDYHRATNKAKSPDAAFALEALMEVPDQFKKIRSLGYLDDEADSVSVNSTVSQGTGSPRHSTPVNSLARDVHSDGNHGDTYSRHRVVHNATSTSV